jgi:hypothetical protein
MELRARIYENFILDITKQFEKYHEIDNIVIYKCVNFQNEICCILGSLKITNLDFILYETILCHFYIGQNNVFQSKNLRSDRLRHSLHPCIFLNFSKTLKSKVLTFEKRENKKTRLYLRLSVIWSYLILSPFHLNQQHLTWSRGSNILVKYIVLLDSEITNVARVICRPYIEKIKNGIVLK